MSLGVLANDSRGVLFTPSLNARDDRIRSQVWVLLADLYPRVSSIERRRDPRYPFPRLIQLTPVGDDDETPCGDSVVVVGKDLSESGVGFYHTAPLPYRRVIATFESADHRTASFLVDLNWCRFTRQRWYESGGRFVRTAAEPAGERSAS